MLGFGALFAILGGIASSQGVVLSTFVMTAFLYPILIIGLSAALGVPSYRFLRSERCYRHRNSNWGTHKHRRLAPGSLGNESSVSRWQRRDA